MKSYIHRGGCGFRDISTAGESRRISVPRRIRCHNIRCIGWKTVGLSEKHKKAALLYSVLLLARHSSSRKEPKTPLCAASAAAAAVRTMVYCGGLCVRCYEPTFACTSACTNGPQVHAQTTTTNIVCACAGACADKAHLCMHQCMHKWPSGAYTGACTNHQNQHHLCVRWCVHGHSPLLRACTNDPQVRTLVHAAKAATAVDFHDGRYVQDYYSREQTTVVVRENRKMKCKPMRPGDPAS